MCTDARVNWLIVMMFSPTNELSHKLTAPSDFIVGINHTGSYLACFNVIRLTGVCINCKLGKGPSHWIQSEWSALDVGVSVTACVHSMINLHLKQSVGLASSPRDRHPPRGSKDQRRIEIRDEVREEQRWTPTGVASRRVRRHSWGLFSCVLSARNTIQINSSIQDLVMEPALCKMWAVISRRWVSLSPILPMPFSHTRH